MVAVVGALASCIGPEFAGLANALGPGSSRALKSGRLEACRWSWCCGDCQLGSGCPCECQSAARRRLFGGARPRCSGVARLLGPCFASGSSWSHSIELSAFQRYSRLDRRLPSRRNRSSIFGIGSPCLLQSRRQCPARAAAAPRLERASAAASHPYTPNTRRH